MFREGHEIFTDQENPAERAEGFIADEENVKMREILTEKCRNFKAESEEYVDNTITDLAEMIRKYAREIQDLVDEYLSTKVNGNVIFKSEDAYDFLVKINNLREASLSHTEDVTEKEKISGLFNLIDLPGLGIEPEHPQNAFKKILDEMAEKN